MFSKTSRTCLATFAVMLMTGALQAQEMFNVNLWSIGRPASRGGIWGDGVDDDSELATLMLDGATAAGAPGWNTTQWENVELAAWPFDKTTPATTINGTSGSTATFEMFNRRNSAPYNWDAVRDDSDVVDVGNATLLDSHVNSTEFDSSNGTGQPFGFQISDFEIRDIPFALYDAVFYFGINGGQTYDGNGTIRINEDVADPSVSRSPWDIGGVGMDMSGGTQFILPTTAQGFEPDGTLDEIEFSGDTGNYIVYESLTDSSLKVQTWGKGFTHLGITGFQIRFSNAEPPAVLADYPLGSVSSGVTDRSSSDTEPLTLAGDVTGGVDPAGDAGGISLPGGEYTAFNSDEAFTGEDFLEFTIELDQATSMSMRKLEFSIDLEGDGSVNNYALRSSADGFVDDIVDTDLYSIPRPGSTTKIIGLTGVAGLQDLQDDVTFRLAFYGGWAGIDSGALLTSLQVTGTVEGDVGTPGDFDEDGDVDGADFLIWQRGDSPNGGSAEEFADWQANFGAVEGAAQATAVPEPTALTLLGLGGILLLMYRRPM